MFKHLLTGYVHQLRNIETGEPEGGAQGAEHSAENTEVADAEQGAENAEGDPDGGAEGTEGQQANDGYPEGTPDWVKKRMSQMSQQKREEKQRADALARRVEELEAKTAKATPDQIANMDSDQLQAYVEALADQRATQLAAERQTQSSKAQKWAGIENTGKESHGEEFFKAATRLHEAGAVGQNFVDALEELDEAADVLMYLGQHQNIDEAARIAALPPVKMAIELARLGPKARSELKKAKSASKAPAPLTPVGSGTNGSPKLGAEPPLGTPAWFEWRNKQVAARKS